MNKDKKNASLKKGFFGTVGGWFRRLFFGGSNDLANQLNPEQAVKAGDVEEIISPGRQILNNFLEKKLAVGALITLLVMFLVMFIGPMTMPRYYDSYTEVTQKSIPPTMDMLSVPGKLKKEGIKMIDSFGSFSVGLSNEGNVFVWGATEIGTTGIDVADIPQEVQDSNIIMVAAGIDHIVALSDAGKVLCWGNNNLGQFVTETEVLERGEPLKSTIAYMPEVLVTSGIDVSRVKKLIAGYQASAILLDDGTLYLWGNKNAYANMDVFLAMGNVYDLDFTLNHIVGVNGKRNTVYTGSRGLYDVVRPNLNEPGVPIKNYIGKRKIESIVATNTSMALLLNDGSVCFTGDFTDRMEPLPMLQNGEKFVQLVGGSYHYSGLTDQGNVYSWGSNQLNQLEVPSLKNVSNIYSGSFQTYATDAEGDLVGKWGLKGYIFGTDIRGADIFQRIINGGRMTMTVGAVAVIISSIIGIIIGCVSGYFGGKVDILLMRVAEIFSAIPFLPFAMILSAVMSHMTISENGRIFIIMCILGVLTWPGLARLVRGQVLVARESEYVTAAKAMGVKESTIAFKHILPNVMSVILVTLMLDFGTCMLTESQLSYLGFGVAYPRPTWGNMLNGVNNATIINTYWWQWLFTALFLAITTICINIVGDALRDVMDPKSSVEK